MTQPGKAHFATVKAVLARGRRCRSSLRAVLSAAGLPGINPVRGWVNDVDHWISQDARRGKKHPVSSATRSSRWPDSAGVYELADASLSGLYSGYVLGRDNTLLAPLSLDVWSGEDHHMLSRVFLPRPKPLPGTSVLLSTPQAESNYWHWLVDLLPKLALLRDSGFAMGDVDHFLVHQKQLPFQRQSFAELGILADRVKTIDASVWLNCERLIVPTLGSRPGATIADWKPEIIRSLFPVTRDTNLPTRLFLSRRSARFRKIVNIAEIEAITRRHGLREIDPGELTFQQQRALFAGADLVLAVHGAALTNLLFASPSLQVIELCPDRWGPPFFRSVSERLGLKHLTLKYPSPGAPLHRLRPPYKRDLVVSPDKLDAALLSFARPDPN